MSEVTTIGKHGGARPGAGAKPKGEQRDAYMILAAAKAKREEYNAELARLEYEQRSGSLVPVADVQAAWLDHVAIAKGRFLALPPRLAPELLGLATLREIEARLRNALVEVLDEMASARKADDQQNNADTP